MTVVPAPDAAEGTRLIVLTTEPQREFRAVDEAKDIDVKAWCPVRTVWRRHARRIYKRHVALYPGYIFAQATETGATAYFIRTRCRTITGWVGGSHGPSLLDWRAIQKLSDQMMAGAFDETLVDTGPRRGDRGVVTLGQIADLPAVVVEAAGPKLKLEVFLFGTSQTVEVAREQFKAGGQ